MPASAQDDELPRRPTVCMMMSWVEASTASRLISSVSAKPLMPGICMSSSAIWNGSPEAPALRMTPRASRPSCAKANLTFHESSIAPSA